jgi:DNA-binding SARP family transcriptional activator
VAITTDERDPREEIRRDGLLGRLERVRPSLVALVAPAGFGKTTLARQLLGANKSAVCDCTGVNDDLDLARRLIPALAAESPARTQVLTRRELMLGDGGTSVAERVRLALEAWSEPTGGSTLIFENAEHLIQAPAARDFFVRLLAHRPADRTIVICSRESLRIHLTRFAAPHEIMVLRATDLAFAREEIARIFGSDIQSDAMLDRILAVTQGWPIAVFLVKRFAAEGRLERLLARLDDVAFEELHDYLVDQVLSSLSPRMVEALFAAACIPSATLSDVSAALKDSAVSDDLAEFAKESPFVGRHGDSLAVHPLLASLLLEHRESKRDTLLRALAELYEQRGEFVRAAELQIARGDHAAAAHSLGQHEVIMDNSPSMEYARVLTQLERSLVRKYPRLWGVTTLLRIFFVDTEEGLEEAEALWRTLPAETPPVERFYIFCFRILFMSYLGMFEEAYELVCRFARESGIGEEPQSMLGGAVFYLRALMTARLGHLNEAEHDLMAALPYVQVFDVMASGTLLTLGADVARARGERALERQFIERALEHARRSSLPNFVAFDLAEAVVGAWLAGETEAMTRSAIELEAIVERVGVRGFAFVAGAARGRTPEPTSFDLLKFVALGRLIMAANAPEAQDAIRYARSALVAAEQHRAPFAECLAALAVALLDEAHAQPMFVRALECAARIESPALAEAVESLVQRRNSHGMLTAFVATFTRERRHRAPALEVEVFSGSVRSNGGTVQLSGRELELLIALSIRREVVTRARLADLLWPELEEYAARNALSVCLHRLRTHLGEDETIVRSEEGYRLCDDATVDLWEAERIVNEMRSKRALTDGERDELCDVYRRLCATRSPRMQGWEWFAPIERRIAELRLDAAMVLASDALQRGEGQAALSYADAMIAYDPCDEPAREVAIRAHLQMGDRPAAMRHLRQYQKTLQAELQCDPSPALLALIGTHA